MQKAYAISNVLPAIQENPFKAAHESAYNILKLVADFMYGTPQRANITSLFALSLAAAGYAMSHASIAILQNCPIS